MPSKSTKPTTSPTKPGVVPIDPDLSQVEHLDPEFQSYFKHLVVEVEALRNNATPADRSLCKSAAEAAQAEHSARIFASEAAKDRDRKGYAEFSRLAQSERRAKSDCLGRLGLTGERRGVAQAKRAAYKVRTSEGTGRWT
jgi:hypothetical protein